MAPRVRNQKISLKITGGNLPQVNPNPKWSPDEDFCQIGSILINRIADIENVPFPANVIYPDSTHEIIANLSGKIAPRHFGNESQDLLLSFHAFLIQTSRHNILVDTCCGNDKQRPTRPVWHMQRGPFLKNLIAVGITPEQIDYVLCTHLHADHVGWNTKLENGQWIPAFPKAQYLFSEIEFNYWKKQHNSGRTEPILYGAYEDSILPVVESGQAKLVKGNHMIETGIFLEPAYGHTPGNVIVHVLDSGSHAVLSGDVIHHPVQLFYPEWSTNFCFNSDESRITRIALLKEFADTKTILLPAHFQPPEYGCITKDGNTYNISI